MKIIIFIFIIFALFSAAFSAVARTPEKPEGKSGYCWSEETGPLEIDEEFKFVGLCRAAICNADTSISILTCGIAVDPDGKRFEQDFSKPYPQCCIKNSQS